LGLKNRWIPDQARDDGETIDIVIPAQAGIQKRCWDRKNPQARDDGETIHIVIPAQAGIRGKRWA